MFWEILKETGNVLGMTLRYQINFQIKPTDVYYPNLWQPTEPLTNTSREDGMFQPITHLEVSWRVSKSIIAEVAATIASIIGRVHLLLLTLCAGSRVPQPLPD